MVACGQSSENPPDPTRVVLQSDSEGPGGSFWGGVGVGPSRFSNPQNAGTPVVQNLLLVSSIQIQLSLSNFLE